MKTFKQFMEATISRDAKKQKNKDMIATHDKPLFKSVPATGVRGDQPASDILKRLVNPVKSGTPTNPFGVKV